LTRDRLEVEAFSAYVRYFEISDREASLRHRRRCCRPAATIRRDDGQDSRRRGRAARWCRTSDGRQSANRWHFFAAVVGEFRKPLLIVWTHRDEYRRFADEDPTRMQLQSASEKFVAQNVSLK
jgi:hypothetical protein